MSRFNILTNVRNGLLHRNRKMILDVIASFEGKEIEIIFQKKKKTRSNPQNAYYFGVIVILMCEAVRTEWGELWPRDKAHEFLKSQFLFTERWNEETGEVIKIPKSTTECTTTEFEDYLLKCRQFLQDWFNVTAPLPNEQITLI
jgi:hypothetical protein